MNIFYIEGTQTYENDWIQLFHNEEVIANTKNEAIQHIMWKYQDLENWVSFKITLIK